MQYRISDFRNPITNSNRMPKSFEWFPAGAYERSVMEQTPRTFDQTITRSRSGAMRLRSLGSRRPKLPPASQQRENTPVSSFECNQPTRVEGNTVHAALPFLEQRESLRVVRLGASP
jgi:hypothetical protein